MQKTLILMQKKIKNKERRKKAEEAVYTVLDLSEWW